MLREKAYYFLDTNKGHVIGKIRKARYHSLEIDGAKSGVQIWEEMRNILHFGTKQIAPNNIQP
jgi:hypothetical protein